MPELKSRVTLLGVCAVLLSCHAQTPPRSTLTTDRFTDSQPVAIDGYSGDAMEPFLSRDGRYLFFNNRNEKPTNTNLYWAARVDDLHFKYLGELKGVNTPALEGVPSMDCDNNFYFVSDRSYGQTASTLYRGRFAGGEITGVDLVPGVSLAQPGIVNFDAEISADGNTLYYVESQFNFLGQPSSARILSAQRRGNSFLRDINSKTIFKSINTETLNYAPATSASERELFFTRLDPGGPAIYMAVRPDISHPFQAPRRIAAITGYVEGPSLSSNENSIYYHQRVNGRFLIYRVTRP